MKKNNLKFDIEDAMNSRKKLQVERDILKEQDEQNKSGKQLLKNTLEDAKLKAKAFAAQILSLAAIWKGVLQIDAAQTQYNRSFGFSNELADGFNDRMMQIAESSGKMGMTFLALNKTVAGIAESTGLFAGNLRKDVLEEATELSRYMDLSNKGMSNLALNAQRTGQNMREQSVEMVKGIRAGEDMVGVTVDMGAAFKAASEVSGLIRANLGRSYEEIARVTASAQALGLTLQDLASISNNMLNFQSSIEAEMTAELFIGKQLNLEKARLYALTGDYEQLQKEIVKNIGTEYDFLKLNTLQKQKYAAALGMSVDQMSNLVFQEGNLEALRDQAVARGDEEMLQMLEKRNLTESFADLMEKIQMTFVNLAKGPLGSFASMLEGVVSSSELLYTLLIGVAAIKLTGIITSLYTMFAATTMTAGAAAWTTGLLTFGIGLAIAIPLILGAVSSMKKSTADAKPTLSFQGLEQGKIAHIEQGEARIHGGESVFHTSNFDVMTDGLTAIEKAINNQQRPHFVWETATSYR